MVQLSRSSAAVEFTVQRGAVSFASGPKGAVQTTLGDATIRPKDALAIGLLHLENSDSAVLFAMKGTLTIRTAHDAKSVDVPEGSAVRITLVDAPPRESGGSAARRKSCPRHLQNCVDRILNRSVVSCRFPLDCRARALPNRSAACLRDQSL